ncbi:MAG: ABC-ATPase domain-containing protein [Gemmatimonadota bacterium]
MSDRARLEALLRESDGRSYPAYRALKGSWDLEAFTLVVDHVQGDPFAAPSRMRVLLNPEQARLPDPILSNESRRWGVAALMARTFARRAAEKSVSRGSERSGEIRMEDPGQLVLPQTAVVIFESGGVEARCTVGLPAKGRRVAGHNAVALLLRDLATVIHRTLVGRAFEDVELERCAAVNEDADAARAELERLGLVAFVADGAILPRESGDDDRPLTSSERVPFASPPTMRVDLTLPNAGGVRGMGVRAGVTLIAGGGFHGKSTLLRAVQDGVWNHAPGDGRELVVTRVDTQKVRAEDGRPVSKVDISPFIGDVPGGGSTRSFSTANASGSTSQAATIMETIEAGARAILIDEDTSATNLMMRDRRMQELVPGEGEPISPFLHHVRTLHDELGVSTVMVVGGSGEYLDVADAVVRMEGYRSRDVTEDARRIAESFPSTRLAEDHTPLGPPAPRRVDPASLDASRGRKTRHVRPLDARSLQFGRHTVDLGGLEQLRTPAQIRTAGLALALASETEAPLPVHELLEWIDSRIRRDGLDALDSRRPGTLAAIRPLDVAAVLNRLRSLRVV